MDKIIMNSPLFKGCPAGEAEAFILNAPCRRAVFVRGGLLLRQGEGVEAAGLILSGRVKAFHTSLEGEERIRNVLAAGDLFGQVLMSSEEAESPVSIEALEDTAVLFIPLRAILNARGACGERLRINLLHMLSSRCRKLTEQITFLSEKSTRGRVAAYLLKERKTAMSDTFTLPLNREALAQLLCVNRSALSRELSKMQAEGLFTFYRGSFKLSDVQGLAACCEYN